MVAGNDPGPRPAARGRRRWTVSLRGLMAGVLVAGGAVGWYVHEATARRAAGATIEAAGGSIACRDNRPPAEDGWWTWPYRRTGSDLCREAARIGLNRSGGASPFPNEPPPPTPAAFVVACAAIRRQGGCESATITVRSATAAGLAELVEARIGSLEVFTSEFTPAILAQVRRLHRPRRLDLYQALQGIDRPLAPLLAAVAALPQLEALRLRGDFGPGDVDLAPLGTLTGLRELDICPSPWEERRLAGLDPLKGLTRLRLVGMRLTDAGLARLAAEHPRLRSLACDGFSIGDRGIAATAGLGDLEVLDLDAAWPDSAPLGAAGPAPGRFTDASLVALGRCRSLRELTLRHGEFTGAGLGALGGLPLIALDLDEVVEPGPGMARLVAGRTFKRLALRGAGITDSDLPALAGHLAASAELDLSGTAVTDAGMPALAGTKMGTLTLNNTRITDRGLATLGAGLVAGRLSLGCTDVAPAALAAFRAARPGLFLLPD